MPRRVRKIDFKAWDILLGLNTSASVNGIVSVQALSFNEPATILRIRGSGGLVAFDQTVQAGDRGIFAVGIAIISTDAFTAGVGSVPDPMVEFDYPWLYLWSAHLEATFAGSAEAQALGMQTMRLPEIDTRAMRKVKPGESLVMIEELQDMTGAPTVLMRIRPARVLIGT